MTASGSRTTGTKVPLGLECSGSVQWTYSQMLIPQGKSFPWAGTYAQRDNNLVISKGDLKPGDLAFTKNCDHVGIYIGKDGNGENLYIHSAGSQSYATKEQPGGRCVISKYSGFTVFRRVNVNFKDDN